MGAAPDLSYDSHSLALALHGASQDDNDLYVMINAYWEDLDFQVKEGTTAEWRRLVDTSLDSPLDFLAPGGESPLQSLRYRVAARSVVVLLAGRIQDVGRRYFGGYLGYEITPLVKSVNYLVLNLADRSRFFSPA